MAHRKEGRKGQMIRMMLKKKKKTKETTSKIKSVRNSMCVCDE